MNSPIRRNTSVADVAFDSRQSFDLDAFAAGYGGVTVSRLKSGTPIFSQGEPAEALYFLQDGQVQITVVSSHGKECILRILEPGSLFGEGSLLGNRMRAATATCISDSVVARLERASVVRAIRENSAIAEFFIVFALSKVVELRDGLTSQLFDSSEIRLARALLLLADQGGTKNFIKNIDQEALAQMIGTTRSRVNHFMNKFRKLGYIDYNGGVISVRGSLSNVAHSRELPGASDDRIAVAC